MLAHPSSIDLSGRTLCLTGRLVGRRGEGGGRRRQLSICRQALLTLTHLRCGDREAWKRARGTVRRARALSCLPRSVRRASGRAGMSECVDAGHRGSQYAEFGFCSVRTGA